jgi:precorrin isomerase
VKENSNGAMNPVNVLAQVERRNAEKINSLMKHHANANASVVQIVLLHRFGMLMTAHASVLKICKNQMVDVQMVRNGTRSLVHVDVQNQFQFVKMDKFTTMKHASADAALINHGVQSNKYITGINVNVFVPLE